MSWGRPLTDNTPKKALCLHKAMSEKAFEGMKCTPHRTSHLHYLQLQGPEAFSGCQSAQHRDLSESNEPRRPHYFLCCQEGVNPMGEARH
uniref:Uncharacterized protein n=1 Tax=Knipowitschia caucasica TaxID=637954 RepID=A0AAV2JPV8_KNICA